VQESHAHIPHFLRISVAQFAWRRCARAIVHPEALKLVIDPEAPKLVINPGLPTQTVRKHASVGFTSGKHKNQSAPQTPKPIRPTVMYTFGLSPDPKLFGSACPSMGGHLGKQMCSARVQLPSPSLAKVDGGPAHVTAAPKRLTLLRCIGLL
jgi:hypothetical protein